ncbi:MAG: outer membrane protein assembly factor BamB [Candidatus Binatia bacterium]|jgi:outer membrane protein assembly factor BamB
MKKSIASILALALVSSAAFAGDWPQFRGPLSNGVADGAGAPTSLSDKSIAWKIDLPGRGISSPIIVGEKVFVTCSSGADQNRLHVICLSAKDGSKIWERQFWATGRTMTHSKIGVASSSPASDGKRVFALFSCNDLVCLDLDGNLQWLRGLTRDYPNASNSLGMASSPVVAGDTLVVQVEADSESFAAGIDVKTGMNRWKLDRAKKANWASPVVYTDEKTGRLVALLQGSKGVLAVDPKTGSELWNFAQGSSTMSSTTKVGDVFLVPSRGLTALKAGKEGFPPEPIWTSNQLSPSTISPMAIGEKVFSVNKAGILNCGDITTGKRLWQLRLKGPFSASPIAAGKYLYVVNEKGLAQVVDTGAEEGEVVSSVNLDDVVIGTPSIANGAFYVRSDAKLWKLAGS